jgi:hypothetical protein
VDLEAGKTKGSRPGPHERTDVCDGDVEYAGSATIALVV